MYVYICLDVETFVVLRGWILQTLMIQHGSTMKIDTVALSEMSDKLNRLFYCITYSNCDCNPINSLLLYTTI